MYVPDGDRLVRVVEQELADGALRLHLALRTERVPEDLVGAREVRMVGMLDRVELVAPRLALDHLHDVLLVEVFEAESDAGSEGHGRLHRHDALWLQAVSGRVRDAKGARVRAGLALGVRLGTCAALSA